MPNENTDNAVRQAARALFQRLLDLLREGRLREWSGHFHEDAIFEFPFAPIGAPQRLDGRAAIQEHLQRLSGSLEVFEVTPPRFDFTLDPNISIARFACRGRAVTTRRPYDQTYLCILEVKDGKIARYIDYWNPLIVLDAFGGAKGLGNAFHEPDRRSEEAIHG